MRRLLIILIFCGNYVLAQTSNIKWTCFVDQKVYDTSFVFSDSSIYFPLINVKFDPKKIDSLCELIIRTDENITNKNELKVKPIFYKHDNFAIKFSNEKIRYRKNIYIYEFLAYDLPGNAHDIYIFYYIKGSGIFAIYYPFSDENDLKFNFNHCFINENYETKKAFNLDKIKKKILKMCDCKYHFFEMR